MAGTAVWVAQKARRAERRAHAHGSFLTVDGVRLHYVDQGQGAPVVLLHGNAVHLEDFRVSGLIDCLAERHRVISFDRPGFGFSERPRDRLWTPHAQATLFQQALVQLNVDQAVVLGHSWGTLVALALALREPNAVRRLILVSGYYFPTARIDAILAAPPALPVIGDILRYTVTAISARLLLNRTVKAMFSPRPVPAAFLPDLNREMLIRPSQIRANAEDAAFMIPGAAGLRKRYHELTMPVAIFAGTEDKVVDPERHARALHDMLPNSELHMLPGLAHMLHHDVPEEIAAAIDSVRTDFTLAA